MNTEDLATVPLKLSPDQCDHIVVVTEAVRSTVQRDEAFATGHVIQQRLRLAVRNDVDIRIDNQPVELLQRVCLQRDIRVVGVTNLDPPLSHHRHQSSSQVTGPMMPVVSQEQESEISPVARLDSDQHESRSDHSARDN